MLGFCNLAWVFSVFFETDKHVLHIGARFSRQILLGICKCSEQHQKKHFRAEEMECKILSCAVSAPRKLVLLDIVANVAGTCLAK